MVTILTQNLLGVGQIGCPVLFVVVQHRINVVEVPRGYREH